MKPLARQIAELAAGYLVVGLAGIAATTLAVAIGLMALPASNVPCRNFWVRGGVVDGTDLESMLGIVEQTIAPEPAGRLPRCMHDPLDIQGALNQAGSLGLVVMVAGALLVSWRAGSRERTIPA